MDIDQSPNQQSCNFAPDPTLDFDGNSSLWKYIDRRGIAPIAGDDEGTLNFSSRRNERIEDIFAEFEDEDEIP